MLLLGNLGVDHAAAGDHPLHAAVAQQAFVPRIVSVAHAAGEHVGHGLEAAMRMVWEAGDVVVRIVAAECVQHQEGIEAALQLAGQHAGQRHARAVRGSDALNDALDIARLVQCGLSGGVHGDSPWLITLIAY